MTKQAAKGFVDGLSRALESTESVVIEFECEEDHPHEVAHNFTKG